MCVEVFLSSSSGRTSPFSITIFSHLLSDGFGGYCGSWWPVAKKMAKVISKRIKIMYEILDSLGVFLKKATILVIKNFFCCAIVGTSYLLVDLLLRSADNIRILQK